MFVLNARARQEAVPRGLFSHQEYASVSAFFDRQPQLAPSPLVHLPALAGELGIRDVLVKDESTRFGLNAFKIVGVQFAVDRLLCDPDARPRRILACATAGNHGRAVARVARAHGLEAKIYVPADTKPGPVANIAREGAEVIVFRGSYDEAVREVAQQATAAGWQIVSDTAWPGYEEMPRWIMLGYTRIFEEAARQWAPAPAPDLVIIQAGVGGLACAAGSWFAHHYGRERPRLIAAEPANAACLLASARAGRLSVLKGRLDTIMAGLRCGAPSSVAWPAIAATLDGFVAVDDRAALDAVTTLARPRGQDPPISAGPSGACGLAALRAVLCDETFGPVRESMQLGSRSVALVVNSEAAE